MILITIKKVLSFVYRKIEAFSLFMFTLFQNIHDLIFKLILGYCAMRCNLFIYMNLMWIEKNQDKSSCTAYNQITPGLYIYVGSDSNQWFSFIAFQDVFAPSVQ